MSAEDRIERARLLYERAVYGGDGDGDHDEALALLKEAGAIAEASAAHRITRQVEEARAQL